MSQPDLNPASFLAFEAQWWQHQGAKERVIFNTFGISSTRFYQLLAIYLCTPAAREQDPITTRILLAAQERQRSHRLAG